ncbi:MAG: septum formation initiator family protein [Ghiorsea sp.]|nr:septum formation initiator family protein [Ghiorsea sp.]
MIWDLIFSDHGYFVFQHEREHHHMLQQEIKHLRAEEARLKEEIIRLREDPKVLEEVIRRELGYVYPDEYMLIMPKADKKSDAAPQLEKEE